MAAKVSFRTIALQYIDDCLSGKKKISQITRFTLERSLRDRKEGVFFDTKHKDYGIIEYIEDEDEGERVCKFAEMCRLPGTNKTIKLDPWQIYYLYESHCWVEKVRRDEDNLPIPRYKVIDLFTTRGSGKTALCAILLMYHTFQNRKKYAKTFCTAGTEKQASILFTQIKEFINEWPAFCKKYGIQSTRDYIHGEIGGGHISLEGNSKNQDGKIVFAAVVDETHELYNQANFNSLFFSLSKVKRSRVFTISTAGKDLSSVGRSIWNYDLQVISREISDENRFALIYTIDKTDDWQSDEALEKSCPGFGTVQDPIVILAERKLSENDIEKRAEFMTKRLNVWFLTGDSSFDVEKLVEKEIDMSAVGEILDEEYKRLSEL